MAIWCSWCSSSSRRSSFIITRLLLLMSDWTNRRVYFPRGFYAKLSFPHAACGCNRALIFGRSFLFLKITEPKFISSPCERDSLSTNTTLVELCIARLLCISHHSSSIFLVYIPLPSLFNEPPLQGIPPYLYGRPRRPPYLFLLLSLLAFRWRVGFWNPQWHRKPASIITVGQITFPS